MSKLAEKMKIITAVDGKSIKTMEQDSQRRVNTHRKHKDAYDHHAAIVNNKLTHPIVRQEALKVAKYHDAELRKLNSLK